MPVIDQIAEDYEGEITFLAVAGRSDFEKSAEEAPKLFSDRLAWGYDDDLWERYEIFGQPVSVLVTADDKVFDGWFGAAPDDFMRERLDALLAVHG